MSRQNQQRHKKAARIAAKKASSPGPHFAEGQVRSNVPSQQPKPNWVRKKVNGKKGWWTKPLKTAKPATPH